MICSGPTDRHQFRHRIQRNGLVVRRLHVELGKIGRIDAELRLRFQDDLIVVGRHVDGADLTRAVGVVELVAHLIDGDAVDRGFLAVDVDGHLRILDVEIGGDVEQSRHLGDLVAHFRRQPVERFSVAALQGVLILALRRPAADVEVLNALEKRLHSRNLRRLLTQPGNHDRSGVASFPIFQRHEQPAVVGGRIRAAGADGAVDIIDRRIGSQNRDQRLLPFLHRLERSIGRGFGRTRQKTRILLREKAFGHDDVECDRAGERCQRHHQHHCLAGQHPVERPFVGAQPGDEHPLEDTKHDIRLLRFVMRLQHPRAQHRRQRQRNEAGHHDRHRDRHREFAEHAADDAAHQQDGEHVLEEEDQPVAEEEPDSLEVDGGAGHELAGLVAVVEAERQPDQVRVDAAAHVHLDVERLAAGDEPAAEHQHRADQAEGEDGDDRQPEGVRVMMLERPVDHGAPGHVDERDRRGLRAKGEQARDGQARPVRLQEAEQAEEDRAVSLRLDHLRNLAVARDSAERAEIDETPRVDRPETRYAKSGGVNVRLPGRR